MDVWDNILFFLTPKEEVFFIYEDSSLGTVMEKMEQSRYTAVPVLKRSGEYLGTATEGDILWTIKNRYQWNMEEATRLPISDLPRHWDNKAVKITTDLDELFAKALEQNFVPVEDDRGMFIGIVTRRNVIGYFKQQGARYERRRD